MPKETPHRPSAAPLNGAGPAPSQKAPPIGTLIVAVAPYLASLVLLPGPLPESLFLASALLQRVTLFLIFCFVWSQMRQWAFALYLYKQDDASPTGTIFRNLGIFLLFCVLLVSMELLRGHIDRVTFLVLMTLLPLSASVQSLRYRGRSEAAFALNTLTQIGWATLSFVVFQGLWDWRAVIFSAGFAAPAAAVLELARRTPLRMNAVRRGLAVSIVAGPGLIGLLPMLGHLPRAYLAVYATLLLFGHVVEKVRNGSEIPGDTTVSRAVRSYGVLVFLLVLLRLLQTLG